MNEEWGHILFIDELRFGLHPDSRLGDSQKQNIQEAHTVQARTFMIWGEITLRIKTERVLLELTLNATACSSIPNIWVPAFGLRTRQCPSTHCQCCSKLPEIKPNLSVSVTCTITGLNPNERPCDMQDRGTQTVNYFCEFRVQLTYFKILGTCCSKKTWIM